jgi:hypothetical protein
MKKRMNVIEELHKESEEKLEETLKKVFGLKEVNLRDIAYSENEFGKFMDIGGYSNNRSYFLRIDKRTGKIDYKHEGENISMTYPLSEENKKRLFDYFIKHQERASENSKVKGLNRMYASVFNENKKKIGNRLYEFLLGRNK